ncbi:uncharacterized protein LOC134251896 [Saccostrea cucullata]|uniref:uncharacterized protein LOC134251896 n=1 Tax=Saccostrea cuccullata TaxID=36930 RepID=UPI002ED4B500
MATGEGEKQQVKDEQDDKQSRIRTLTEKGQASFDQTFLDLQEKCTSAWREVEDLIANCDGDNTDRKYLRTTEDQINAKFKQYLKESQALANFLERARTEQALQKLEQHESQYSTYSDIVFTFRDVLHNKLLEAAEQLSEKFEVKSRTSSQASKTISEIFKKRVKAETQQTRLKFLEEQAALEKQKAATDIDIWLSKEKEAAAVANAEVNAMENYDRGSQGSFQFDIEEQSVERTARERTEAYVNSQASNHSEITPSYVQHDDASHRSRPASISQAGFHFPTASHVQPHEQSPIVDLSNYLLKKDLLLHRFSAFDDSAQNYTVWKVGFLNILKELKASPIEELDLLTKWLGPESKRYALSIRSANTYQPERGLSLIWARLEDLYGKPEMVEAALKSKLKDFPKITEMDPKRYYDLLDLLYEIESNKQDPKYSRLLGYYDTSSGILPIVSKLTNQVQDKWATRASQYKRLNHVPFPPFSIFVSFIQEICELKNDPGLISSTRYPPDKKREPTNKVFVRKSDVGTETPTSSMRCPIHKADHSLEQCRAFLAMTFPNKRDFLKSRELCFRCCKGKHRANKCKLKVSCDVCKSDRHVTCMHFHRDSGQENGGESSSKESPSGKGDENIITSSCTRLCGKDRVGRSCGKIVLVNVYPSNRPDLTFRTYAMIDDQSNRTLARSKFFDHFGLEGNDCVFTLNSCGGSVTFSGRTAEGFVIEPVSAEQKLYLPKIIECDEIPNNRKEIPTPEVASAYQHLLDIAPLIPDLDHTAEILLLIGRDLIQAHHVIEQKLGPPDLPFAQKLYLGWTIIGEVCLGSAHRPNSIVVNKTHVLDNGRSTLLEPCDSKLLISQEKHQHGVGSCTGIFCTTVNDETPGMSTEDRQFLEIMDREFHRDSYGKWTAPLPFQHDRPVLPNNYTQAMRRAIILDASLRKNPTKLGHALEFMRNIFDRNHAEVAPPLKPNEECWYLPIFGVYHPLKPEKIRMVFDSSARFQDLSLNSVLLSGPDLTNSLIGVLMRFRMEAVAVTADIEQMFHCFGVSEKHRNFLRFLWYTDNDPTKPLTEYRMTVQVFGNTPSPAVATYGFRLAAIQAEHSFGKDVREFVERNFYVDDGLVSLPTTQEAIDLLRRTQQALLTHGNLRLHKIASNDPRVMQSFDVKDLAKDLIDLDITHDDLPTQRSLGLVWDLQRDAFGFKLTRKEKPYTKRGVLSCVNSLYDPLGFIAPITIQGKLLLREMTQAPSVDWDAPLPEEFQSRWDDWTQSLTRLGALNVPRKYLPIGFSQLQEKNVLIFTDASEVAIASVAYLFHSHGGDINLGFIMGKSKVAPRPATSIPRLELCAAVLGVEIATIIRDQLDINADHFKFYTDSRIVLGYVYNRTKRFLTYVSNRVQRILSFSKSSQWNYIPTDQNPADHGTKSTIDSALYDSWLSGPIEWLRLEDTVDGPAPTYDLVDPTMDKEIKQDTVVCKVDVSTPLSWTSRFERFSSWKNLVRAIMCLKRIVHAVAHHRKDIKATEDSSAFRKAEELIIHHVQLEVYEKEITALKNERPLPRNSPILRLNPSLDEEGMVRVGGRLQHGDFDLGERSPILVPGSHHIAKLLALHFHELTHHQGRHITEGAIRNAGLWITGAKRIVTSLIYKCVICCRGRGKLLTQKMADLPAIRLKPSPPFTYVGVDCFGPWSVTTRRTRGGSADSKRWAALFTCMCCRAVHIEVLEQMNTPSFVNALRRFYAIRGDVKEFYSDRGTNFVGSVRELGINSVNVEDAPIHNLLTDKGTVWRFNPPHSSHMGGTWERLIGVTRRILDAILQENRHVKLTHEVLTTFLAEVSAIVNNRPIVPIATDTESPQVLTPNVLLTQKMGNVSESHMNFDVRDMYTSQWKIVQILANRFWDRWRKEYLQSLQERRKWADTKPNVQEGDIVLMKDAEHHRNFWPLCRVTRVFPSEDHLVRKVELMTFKDGAKRTYVRPITQIVLLLSNHN